ncbi:MAG: glycosyltransferase family 39 protein [Saprospiraceae bacterium]|nr:glycosyltransferase family 39 protein [Saprospiraceae bacterium]
MSVKSTKKKAATSTLSRLSQLPRWLAVLIVVLFLFIRIGFRDIPIERDEGSYTYMGQLLLKGGVPYQDFYEMKPPALYYSYAVLSALSGGDIALMHVWMAVFLAIGGMLLFYLVSRWLNAGAGLIATLSYAVLAMTPYASGFSIQAEHLVAVFSIAGLWALARGLQQATFRMILLAGFLLAWGVLIKQNGLFFALLGASLIPAFHLSENKTQWLKFTLSDSRWLLAGALIPILGFGLIMFLQGTLGDFWFWIVEYPQAYTSKIDWDMGRKLLENSLTRLYDGQEAYWVLGLSGAVLVWFTRISWYKKWAVTGFLMMAVLSILPGKRFYGHYFLHFIPALAIGAGAFTFFLSYMTERWIPSLQKWIAPVLAAFLLLPTMAHHDAYYFRPNFNKILRETYGSNPFPESRQLANYLNKRMQPDDGLIVLGSEPQLYAYTQAKCPTRHHFMGFLLKNHPKEKEWQQEVIDAVQADPPKYAVWVQHPLSWLPAPGADQGIINWGWRLIHQDYVPIAWYDQVDKRNIQVVEGDEAAAYQAKGEQYMVLLERKRVSPTVPN